jgi:uncharacterized repeat protein (TIGR03803 family)
MLVAPGATLAQTLTVLHNFGGKTNLDGDAPTGKLTLAGETLYGTTGEGGSNGGGTVFSINTDGNDYAVRLHCSYPDTMPRGPLVLTGERLYGAALGLSSMQGPGPPGPYYTESWGSLFSLATNGTGFERLVIWGAVYWFWGVDLLGPEGGHPQGGLILAGHTLYGTGHNTGSSVSSIFCLNTNGQNYAVLRDLDGSTAAGLVAGGTTLFGTTFDGGSNNLGTVFAFDVVTTQYTLLKHFTGPDGAAPYAGLVLDGVRLYGTTESGGQFGYGTVFALNTSGTEFVVLKHFSGPDGAYPHADLCLSGARLFGTSGIGGDLNHGTVFQIQTNGADFAVLKSFNGTDGDEPAGGLVLLRDTLYGTTADGGTHDRGVLFRLQLKPALSGPAYDGTNFCFSFQTVNNLNYTVEGTDNLTVNNWVPVKAVVGDGSCMRCVVPATNATSSFFRVRQP